MTDLLQPQQPAPGKKATETKYVVLALDDSKLWELRQTVSAASAKAALQKVLGDGDEGTYVAVPERSWQPIKVQAETKTVLRFTDV